MTRKTPPFHVGRATAARTGAEISVADVSPHGAFPVVSKLLCGQLYRGLALTPRMAQSGAGSAHIRVPPIQPLLAETLHDRCAEFRSFEGAKDAERSDRLVHDQWAGTGRCRFRLGSNENARRVKGSTRRAFAYEENRLVVGWSGLTRPHVR